MISRSRRASAPHRGSPAGPASRLLLAALAGLLVAGCSINRTIAGLVGNALAGSGGVYASEDHADLIRDAIPFGLKTLESLLEASPTHRDLLLGAARGFTLYAYLLQDEADRLDAVDLARARELRARARKLYLRGRSYALRGLETEHPAFTATLRADRAAALRTTTARDVPFLYWAGVSGAGALSVAKDDLDLLGALPTAGALIRRVLELIILGVAMGLTNYLVDAEVPMRAAAWVQATIHSKLLFLLVLNLFLLLVGCLMDIFSAIVVVGPLILPMSQVFGIHPAHLGIIFLANLELGYLTPPIGMNLFLAAYRFDRPLPRSAATPRRSSSCSSARCCSSPTSRRSRSGRAGERAWPQAASHQVTGWTRPSARYAGVRRGRPSRYGRRASGTATLPSASW